MAWRDLPAEGRQGDAPAWPLTKATQRELSLWAIHWAMPQAVVWEENHLEFEVAMYVRNLAESERRGAASDRRKHVRVQQGGLLLTLDAMLKAHVRIPGAMAPELEARATGTDGRPSIRERMKAIDGGA